MTLEDIKSAGYKLFETSYPDGVAFEAAQNVDGYYDLITKSLRLVTGAGKLHPGNLTLFAGKITDLRGLKFVINAVTAHDQPGIDEDAQILHFNDRSGNRYEINFSKGDVTICGYFVGSVKNVHEWIYANLGYNNPISSVTNLATKKSYMVGELIDFLLPRHNLEGKAFSFGTIKAFYVDSFSAKIGIVCEEPIGRVPLSEL